MAGRMDELTDGMEGEIKAFKAGEAR